MPVHTRLFRRRQLNLWMDSGFFSNVGADQKPVEARSAAVDLLKQLVRQHPELLTELLKEAAGERI